METMNNPTDRYFRDRLAGFEAMPDDRVWAGIAGKTARNRRKKALLMYFRIAAGMALLVSLGIGAYQISAKKRTIVAEKSPVSPTVAPTASHRLSTSLEVTTPSSTAASHVAQTVAQPVAQTVAQTVAPSASHRLSTSLEVTAGYSPVAHAAPLLRQPFLPRVTPVQFDESVLLQELYADLEESETETSGAPHAWKVGSEIAPLYSYRTIASDYLSQSSMTSINRSEDGLFAYAGGFRVGYATGKRITIESGIYYSRYGQEKNKVEAYTTRYENMNDGLTTSSYLAVPNSTGQIIPDGSQESGYDKVVSNATGSKADLANFSGFPGISAAYYSSQDLADMSVTQYFDYLEVPLVVKYRVVDRKLGLSVTGGVVTNFLVNNGLTLHYDGKDENLGRTGDIQTINYQGSVGLGIDYPLMDRVAFSLTPRFRYYLNPIDKSAQINVHPYSFGVFAGLSYTFK